MKSRTVPTANLRDSSCIRRIFRCMAAKPESFYNDDGHLTERGNRASRPLVPVLKKLFLKAKTPREAMDLERSLRGDVSIACSIRILHFQYQRIKRKGRGK